MHPFRRDFFFFTFLRAVHRPLFDTSEHVLALLYRSHLEPLLNTPRAFTAAVWRR